jgi:biotin carboxyl carrier protein
MPRYHVIIDDREYDISVEYFSERFQVTCNGRSFEIERRELGGNRALMMVGKEALEVDVHSHPRNGQRSVFMSGNEIAGTVEDYSLAQMRKAAGISHKGTVESNMKAPMPGMVIDIRVKEGDAVAKGEPLVVIEAMKMENIIKAREDVVIKTIKAIKGKSVEKGDILLEFDR